MTLTEFHRLFPHEDACRNYLKNSREKNGLTCKKCKSQEHYWLKKKSQWQCKSCGFRTTLKSGTLFHGSNLKLSLWFQAIYLISNTRKSISACELQKKLGLKRYEPAWYMAHKIRLLMYQINDFDAENESFVQKFKITNRRKKPDKTEDGMDEKCIFMSSRYTGILALNRSENGIHKISFKLDPSFPVLLEDPDYILSYNTPAIHGLGKYKPAFKRVFPKIRVNQPKIKTKKLGWMETAIRNFKNIVYCIHHKVSLKYMQFYLEEFCFKYNFRNHEGILNLLLRNGLSFYW